MRKIWKVTAVALACVSIACVCAVACQGMEDVAPESYGAWENNYIYRANGRMKTTGEDYEQLVSSFTVGENEYTVTECVDYEFFGEDLLYMILKGEYETTERIEENYAVIKYDISEKESALIFSDTVLPLTDEENSERMCYRAREFYKITDEKIYIFGMVENEKYLYDENVHWINKDITINHDGEILTQEDFEYNDWVEYAPDIQIYNVWSDEERGYIYYYRENKDAEVKQLFVKDSNTFNVSYVEQNGVRGLLLQKSKLVSGAKPYTLSFYNLDTFEWCEKTVSISKSTKSLYGKYYYLYRETNKEYYEFMFEKKTAQVHTNGELCELVIDESGVRLEKIYSFKPETSITLYGLHDDKLVYRALWFESASCGNIFGGSEYAYYEENIKTGEKRIIENTEALALEDEYAGYYEMKSGVTVEDYTYFLHTEDISEGIMSTPSTAYLLKRYNALEDKFEVMQFWHEDDARLYHFDDGTTYYNPSEYSHCCAEFWFSVTDRWQQFKIFDF